MDTNEDTTDTSSESIPEVRKRGSYKKYKTDPTIKIPESTIRSWKKAKAAHCLSDESTDTDSSFRETDDKPIADQNIEDCRDGTDANISFLTDCEYNESDCSVVSSEDNDEDIESYSDISDDDSDSDENSHDVDEDSDYVVELNCIRTDNSDDDSNCNDNDDIDSRDDANEVMDTISQGNSSLYENSDITREESELLIMALTLRHHMPDVCLDNLLKVIDCHLPQVEYGSKFKFLQHFKPPEIVYYFYCSYCSELLHFEESVTELFCEFCKNKYKKSVLKERGEYFIHIPLTPQLISTMNSELYEHFHKISNKNDVVNGSLYSEHKINKIIEENDISIQWNTDGVKLFMSSKYSLWPIQVEINELPYRLRKNNIVLCGVWCNVEKPPMNMFLKPFVEELIDLSTNGFTCTTINSMELIKIKVHTLFAPVDSVARPLIQNMHQFNGKYGCSYCLHKGERITIGSGHARMYPGKKKRARTKEEHEQFAESAFYSKKVVKGVKNNSITMLIPNFNIIESFPPEYMHCCLLGVGKLFITAWFDTKNYEKQWYLGRKVKEYNDKLLSILPPIEITRTPKPVTEGHYKASEWKNHILYYSLCCLNNIMPKKYLNHWFLFVYSINIYYKEKITEEELKLAKMSLYKFVNLIEELYGKEYMKYNVHLLLHLPKYVEMYGALWAWSAFPYEHYNGVLKKLFFGTQCVPQQICKSYFRLQCIKSNSHVFSNSSERVKKAFVSLMSQCRVSNCIVYGDKLRILSTGNNIKLSVTEKLIIEQLLEKNIHDVGKSYERFIYKNVVYHGNNYKRFKKRNNSFVNVDDNFLCIEKLVQVNSDSNEVFYVLIGKHLHKMDENLMKVGKFSSGKFCSLARLTTTVVCYNVTSIKKKCISIGYENDKWCLFTIDSNLETD